jgi:SNF2 family DNA or RNA helicase
MSDAEPMTQPVYKNHFMAADMKLASDDEEEGGRRREGKGKGSDERGRESVSLKEAKKEHRGRVKRGSPARATGHKREKGRGRSDGGRGGGISSDDVGGAPSDDGYGSEDEWPKFKPGAQRTNEGKVKEPLLLPGGGSVAAPLNQWLHEYQRVGITWLYNLYLKKQGGILGDDMGLGKTVQVLCFISAVLGKSATPADNKQLRRRRKRRGEEKCGRLSPSVATAMDAAAAAGTLTQDQDDRESKGVILVIVPTTIVANWENECKVWGCFEVMTLSGKDEVKERVIEAASNGRVEIVITSYEMLAKKEAEMSKIKWLVVILGEWSFEWSFGHF